MTIRARIAGIAVVAVLAAVLAAVGAPAPAASGPPAEMTSQQYEALMLRSGALNILYGLGKPAGMTDAQYRAELIRGAALNERYGLPVALGAEQTAGLYGAGVVGEVPSVPTVTPSVDGFDWGDATIGAGFVAGLFLLGAAGVLVVRRRPHLGAPLHRR